MTLLTHKKFLLLFYIYFRRKIFHNTRKSDSTIPVEWFLRHVLLSSFLLFYTRADILYSSTILGLKIPFSSDYGHNHHNHNKSPIGSRATINADRNFFVTDATVTRTESNSSSSALVGALSTAVSERIRALFRVNACSGFAIHDEFDWRLLHIYRIRTHPLGFQFIPRQSLDPHIDKITHLQRDLPFLTSAHLELRDSPYSVPDVLKPIDNIHPYCTEDEAPWVVNS